MQGVYCNSNRIEMFYKINAVNNINNIFKFS